MAQTPLGVNNSESWQLDGYSSKSLPTHWIAWKLGSSLHLVLLPSASPVFLLPQSTAVRPLEVLVAPPCRPPDWAHGCKAPLESLEVGLTGQFAVETCVVHWKKPWFLLVSGCSFVRWLLNHGRPWCSKTKMDNWKNHPIVWDWKSTSTYDTYLGDSFKLGIPSHHACFNTESWSSMTWMIWGYILVRKPPFFGGKQNDMKHSKIPHDSWNLPTAMGQNWVPQ